MEGQAGGQTSGNGGGQATVTATTEPKAPESLTEALAVIQDQAGKLAELTASVKSLKSVQSDLDKLKTAQQEAEEAAAKEAGKFEDLHAKEKATREQVEAKLAARDRLDAINDAVESAEGLAFSIKAVKKTAKRIDAETQGEHSSEELIELAVKELESFGVVTKPDTMAIGGTGSTGAGAVNSDSVEIAELKTLHKKGRDGDLTAQRDFAVKSSLWQQKHPGQKLPAME
jgi:chromosome segregation ATPase